MILWKGRIDRAEQLYVGYKTEGKWGLRWGFCTSSFEEQLHQLGSGRKQLTCLSGISDKCLMEGLFTKMRQGRRESTGLAIGAVRDQHACSGGARQGSSYLR